MAYGFKPVKHVSGGVIRTNNFEDYTIASAYGTALYQGDPVMKAADGSIVLGAAGNVLYCGIFSGVSYIDSVTGDVIYNAYWPADQTATKIKAFVYDDPWMKLMVEADQDTTPLVSGDVGMNCDHIAGSGSNITKLSGVQLDSSDQATGDGMFRVVGSAQDENETEWTSAGTTMDVYVVAVEHFWLATTGID